MAEAVLTVLEMIETDDDEYDDASGIDDETTSSSSASASDDEMEMLCVLQSLHQKAQSDKIRKKDFFNIIIPGFSQEVFKSHFRMYPETFEYVLSVAGPYLHDTQFKPRRKVMAAKEQLLLAIWILATPDSYRSVCEKFDVDKTTAIRAVHRVAHTLCNLAPKFINWPVQDHAKEVMEEFEKYSAFPNVLGAIDGTHVKINPPKEDKQSYINRKGYPSVQVQAVCTRNLLFTSVYAGHTGSVHDARVFRLSPVQKYLGDPEYFPNNSHLVGDAAYGIHPNIMVPFKDNGHLTLRQKNFNFCLSSARMAIERAFGLWKARWRRIRECLPMVRTDRVPEFIMATCVLHNICILKKDFFLATNNALQTTEIRRGTLTPEEMRSAGSAKRMQITNSLIIRSNSCCPWLRSRGFCILYYNVFSHLKIFSCCKK